MGRIARRIDKNRIARLQVQIDDPRYISAAVDGLADRMTNRLVNGSEPKTHAYRSNRSSNSIDALFRVLDE